MQDIADLRQTFAEMQMAMDQFSAGLDRIAACINRKDLADALREVADLREAATLIAETCGGAAEVSP
jgi:hypothetical protein